MDKLNRLLEIGISEAQAKRALEIFCEEDNRDKLSEETEKLKSEISEKEGEIKRIKEQYSAQAEELNNRLRSRETDIRVLEELYKAGAKNPRFIMEAFRGDGFCVDDKGVVKGFSERLEELKKSDSYLFSVDRLRIGGFIPEEEGDFSLERGERTYSQVMEMFG